MEPATLQYIKPLQCTRPYRSKQRAFRRSDRIESNSTETPTTTNLINTFTELCTRGKINHSSQVATTQGSRTHQIVTHNPTDQAKKLSDKHRHSNLANRVSTNASHQCEYILNTHNDTQLNTSRQLSTKYH